MEQIAEEQFQKNIKDNKYISLIFVGTLSFIITASETYQNIIFLHTYSVNMIPYLLLFSMLLNCALYLSTIKIFSTNLKIKVIWFLIVSITIIVIFHLLKNYYQFKFLIFIYTLLLMAFDSVVSLLAWRFITTCFDITSFKSFSKNITIVSTAINMLSGLLIMLVIPHIGTHFFPYVIIFGLFFAIFSCKQLNSIKERSLHKKHNSHIKSSLYKDKLFVVFLVYATIAIFSFMVIDFLFKEQLNLRYDKEKIGYITALIITISNFISIIIQQLVVNCIINKFGPYSLLKLLPLFWVIISFTSLFIPSFWLMCILFMGKQTIYYSFNKIGDELVLSAYNTHKKFKISTALKILSSLIGGIGSFMLVIYLIEFNRVILIGFVLVSGIICLFITYRLPNLYKIVLQRGVEVDRFNILNDNFNKDKNVLDFYQIALAEDLRSNDPKKIIYAIRLLELMPELKIDNYIYILLKSEDIEIRYHVAHILYLRLDSNGLTHMVSQIDHEKNVTIFWLYCKAILSVNPLLAKAVARKCYYSESCAFKYFLLKINIEQGSFTELSHAISEVKDLISSTSDIVRYQALKIIPSIRSYNIENIISKFLYDEKEYIVIEAINMVAKYSLTSLVPNLISIHCKTIKIKSIVSKAIMNIGIDALPYLENEMYKKHKLYIIYIIASMPNKEAEKIIKETENKQGILGKNIIAKSFSYKATSYQVSKDFMDFAQNKYKEEIVIIKQYIQYYWTDCQYKLKEEIMIRISLAKDRLLHWICVFVDSMSAIKVTPKLLSITSKNFTIQERSKAVELISISLKKNKISVDDFVKIFSENCLMHFKECLNTNVDLQDLDPEIVNIINNVSELNNCREGKMNKTLISFILRNTDIFKTFPIEFLVDVAEKIDTIEYSKEEQIFKEGDEADGIYIIFNGEVNLYYNNVYIETAKEYSSFGELAVIKKSKREKTAIAKTKVKLLYLDSIYFDLISSDIPEFLYSASLKIINELQSMVSRSGLLKKT